MSKNRIAEKHKKVVEAVRKGTAEVKTDKEGRRKIVIKEPKAVRRSFLGTRIFYNCPKCGKVLEFSMKKHRRECKRCKQLLDWKDYDNLSAVYLLIDNSEDAYYWAMQYKYFNNTTYDLDIDAWRLISKDYPSVMFFPFTDSKAYGRFMREAAKDAVIVGYF